MDQIVNSFPAHSPTLRIAVVGNSNSAMSVSFARALAKAPDIVVENKSIGAVPNVILLDFLAHESDFDYDFIIIETAVCDFLHQATYSAEKSRETFELFITSLRLISSAQIIMLAIPTRHALVEPGAHWQEPLYLEVAERFGIPILNGFGLVRKLVGWPKMERVDIFSKRARKLISSFGLPSAFFYSFVYRSLRDPDFRPNALGVFGFADHAHLSAAMHALVGTLLHKFISSTPSRRHEGQAKGPSANPVVVMESKPEAASYVSRMSSLVSRELAVLSSDGTVCYRCPPGYRALGLLVNTSGSLGTLCVESPAGNTTLDFAFGFQPHKWVALIVPIFDVVGDGDIRMTIIPGDQGGSAEVRAELGEVILVKTDWREVLPVIQSALPGTSHIEEGPWAEQAIADAAAQADAVVFGIDADVRVVDPECFAYAANLLGDATAPLSHANRARMMVVMGMMDKLRDFLDTARTEQNGNAEIEAMRIGLREANATNEMPYPELLHRAIGLARSGAFDESDALLTEGMARSMGKTEFFIEWGRNAAKRKNWPEANRRWSLVRSMFPENATGYVEGASALVEMGGLDEAASLLSLTAKTFPNNPIAFISHAWLETRRGAWDAAADLWAVIRAKFPYNQAGYIGGAIVFHKYGRFIESDSLISEGRDQLPGDREVAFWWADLAAQRLDWREAARRWLALRMAFPMEVRCILDAARALTEAGEIEQAEAMIAEAHELFPNEPRAVFGWADAADRRSDWPVSAERWRIVRERFPTERRAYVHEMRALEASGARAAAEVLARHAIGLFPDHPDVIRQAAAIATRCGDFAAAAERYAAAYALDSNNADTIKRYVDVLATLNREAEIALVLDEVLSKLDRNETLIRLRIENALRSKMFDDALRVWGHTLQRWGEERDFPSEMAALIIKASPPEEDLQTLLDFLCPGSDGPGGPDGQSSSRFA